MTIQPASQPDPAPRLVGGPRHVSLPCLTTDRWAQHTPTAVRVLKLHNGTWIAIYPCTLCDQPQHARPVARNDRTLLYSLGVTPLDLADPEWTDPARTSTSPLDQYDANVWLEDLDDAYLEHHGALAALAVRDTDQPAVPTRPAPAAPSPSLTDRLVAHWRKGWTR